MSYNIGIVDSLNKLLDTLRVIVRNLSKKLAIFINKVSNGSVSPDSITYSALFAHIFIALFIASGHLVWAAFALIIFGLFDTLDGELARLQNKASKRGMLLDATTDRAKEILLYMGAAFYFVYFDIPYNSVWAVAACGSSLLVSYVKAKGESAVSGTHLVHSELNRLFADGLMRYEVRMGFMVVGLFINQLAFTVIVIAVMSSATALSRMINISGKIS